MKHTWFTAFALSLLFASAACGEDDDARIFDAPVATIDAPDEPDAPIPPTDCESYCACMPVNCPGSFPDDMTCMTTCLALDATNQDCRDYHCSVAVGANAAMHCPHARGEAMCL